MVLLIRSAVPVVAQQSAVEIDSAHAQIRTTLRSFYFNLAHRDWEALASDILSAKVMASHPMPERLLAMSSGARPAETPTDCSSTVGARVEQAGMVLDGNWAAALVPHCPSAKREDEFRLVRFERRWRIIYIDLSPETSAIQLAR